MTLSRLNLVFHVVGPVGALVLVVAFWSTPADLAGVILLGIVLAGAAKARSAH